ncbi:MAG: sialidase family protein [Armatimonadota bacterium]|nr:sialidase family protein [Armatimonadota bacterium]MDR7450719.1 sialidase family protein [Armatimonadota bacterium]MDR7466075.1 sialidase family protein [Armatimonadota bacterium]MDR7493888.1 sialidase family protein [Armatimonadota bacterium]MDR7546090.1 sialidase family protein [Armatimonadota bacterium]
MTAFLRLLPALLLLAAAHPAPAQTIVAADVSEDTTEWASQPKIARDPNGSLHLAFVKSVGGTDQVHVASSTDDGRSWRVRRHTAGPAASRYPTLAAGPNGDLHLAWTTYEPIGHIYYSRFDGRRWSPPLKISPGNEYAGIPALAVDPAGAPHVVWYGIRRQAPPAATRHGSVYEILYSGWVGGRWSSPVVISPGLPDSINPALAADRSGTLHSAWYQLDGNVYQVRYARRSGEWEFPEQVSAGEADAFAVALAAHPDGRVYVVWEHRGRPTRVYFAERRTRWIARQPISPEGQDASTPAVAVDDGGRVYAVWSSRGQLYLRRRDRVWQGTERLTAEGTNTDPVVAARGAYVDLMWTQVIGQRRLLRFATLAGPRAAARGGAPAVWAAAIPILLALLLLWQWHRRPRPGRT